MNAEYYEFLKRAQEEFEIRFTSTDVQNNGKLKDFKLARTLGEGAFGRVLLAHHLEDSKYYALKCLDKVHILRQKQLAHTINEKKILFSVNSDFIVKLYFHFKDTTNLYLVMDYIQGGELFTHLSKFNYISEDSAKFYAGQVILAFEYLHNVDIIHRDLKPENLLIADNGYIKLTDFGFAKRVLERTWTLCGTPEYLAPEIIMSKGYGKAVDWWTLGILIYEMAAGETPFYDRSHLSIYEKIIKGKISCPLHFSTELKDLCENLIEPQLTRRFGNLKDGSEDIKKHEWFSNMDFDELFHLTAKSPYVPNIKGPDDASNFDVYNEKPMTIRTTDAFQSEFEDF